ncbi:hypothetical protein ACFQZ4_37975 [Catellatospora coxensis]|uniref:hypothetical protein n=1 Tax=Catellatospora coxensis TaxID=310354 RepID=UPI0019411E37|nr:hypothetical protein [Catellatospora coxensis]
MRVDDGRPHGRLKEDNDTRRALINARPGCLPRGACSVFCRTSGKFDLFKGGFNLGVADLYLALQFGQLLASGVRRIAGRTSGGPTSNGCCYSPQGGNDLNAVDQC